MIEYRALQADELGRVGEIDRTERIDVLYVQRGAELEAVEGDFSAAPWQTDGDSTHSVAHQIEECGRHVAAGGMAVGAFDGDHLVAIGIVVPHVRPGIAQLAFLHVSNRYRGAGVGRRLNDMLEQVAREAGDTTMVVSATPSENTVRFYHGRGYEPTASPLPELVELEPEDIHFEKRLGP